MTGSGVDSCWGLTSAGEGLESSTMAAGPPGRRAAGPLKLRPRDGHEGAFMAAASGPSVLPA